MFAVNAPAFAITPLSVLASVIVGFPVVFQHTPYAVGEGAPKLVILPLATAEVALMSLIYSEITLGIPLTVIVTDVVSLPPVFDAVT